MKLLIDTNVFIPLEPTRPTEKEALTEPAATLVRLAIESAYQLYLHPASKVDLKQDTDETRSELRRILLEKYPVLPDPPSVSTQLESQLGSVPRGTNDWVDHQLLAALAADATDFLVTEDLKLRNKARRLGLGNRVVTVVEAISLIRDLSERVPSPPPAVRPVKAHVIDLSDPILDSFRQDYPGFDNWFRRCRRQHRQAWIIEGDRNRLAAFCIIKRDDAPPVSLSGKLLKLCSFKVSEEFNGFRFGELLLKAVFEHAFDNRYDWIFVTVFQKYNKLIELFEDFGFSKMKDKTMLGELILAKPLRPEVEKRTVQKPLDYHIRYGPRLFRTEVPWYVIPIQPRFARVLFPESARQRTLLPGLYAFGNAIKKAYLCNSPTRSIPRGSALLFYRSRKERGGISIGIVEETLISSSSEEIARAVGKRTVYTLKEIEELCRRAVLTILFRQARVFRPPIPYIELIRGGVFSRPPQSVMALEGEGLEWAQNRMAA